MLCSRLADSTCFAANWQYAVHGRLTVYSTCSAANWQQTVQALQKLTAYSTYSAADSTCSAANWQHTVVFCISHVVYHCQVTAVPLVTTVRLGRRRLSHAHLATSSPATVLRTCHGVCCAPPARTATRAVWTLLTASVTLVGDCFSLCICPSILLSIHRGFCTDLWALHLSSCHQWMCAVAYFEGFVINPPVFCSIAMLWFVSKAWQVPFAFWCVILHGHGILCSGWLVRLAAQNTRSFISIHHLASQGSFQLVNYQISKYSTSKSANHPSKSIHQPVGKWNLSSLLSLLSFSFHRLLLPWRTDCQKPKQLRVSKWLLLPHWVQCAHALWLRLLPRHGAAGAVQGMSSWILLWQLCWEHHLLLQLRLPWR